MEVKVSHEGGVCMQVVNGEDSFCPLLRAACRESKCSWWLDEDQESHDFSGHPCMLIALYWEMKSVNDALHDLHVMLFGYSHSRTTDPGLFFELLDLLRRLQD